MQATSDLDGLDVYSPTNEIIPAGGTVMLPLDIAVTPPVGTYCQLLSRSGLLTKRNIEVKAGTIDWDYTGNVTVVLQNNNDQPYKVAQGQKIAQMAVYNITQLSVTPVNQLTTTICMNKGFGSMHIHSPRICKIQDTTQTIL